MSEQFSERQSSLRAFVERLVDVTTDDPVHLRRGRLVNVVILISLVITVVWLLVSGLIALFSMQSLTSGTPGPLAVTAVILAATYGLNRQSASPAAGLILALAALGGSVLVLLISGPLTTFVIGLTVPVLIAGLLGPPASAFLLATLAGVAYGWLNVVRDPGYLGSFVAGEGFGDTAIVYLNLYVIATLGWLFSRMAGRAIRAAHAKIQALMAQQEVLQNQLNRQAGQMRATTRVARGLAGTREIETLLRNGVERVQQFFGHTIVQIFLADTGLDAVVLRASTSRAAQRMITREHAVSVGSASSVGQAAARRVPVIGDRTSIDLLLQVIEHAPDIRSELAVPLIVRDELIGVLHLQSKSEDAFKADELTPLEALADQLAVGIANAQVYEEAQRNLRELGKLSQQATQRGWQTFLVGRSEEERVHRHGRGDALWPERQESIAKQVIQTRKMVSEEAGDSNARGYLAVPMLLREEVVGVVGVETEGVRRWSQEDVSILERIAARATLAVENIRLFEQANRTAQREQLINTIASRLERAPDLRTLLEGVATELSEALGTDRVYAQFTLSKALPGDGGSRRAGDGNGSGQGRPSPNGDVSGDSEEEQAEDVSSRSSE